MEGDDEYIKGECQTTKRKEKGFFRCGSLTTKLVRTTLFSDQWVFVCESCWCAWWKPVLVVEGKKIVLARKIKTPQLFTKGAHARAVPFVVGLILQRLLPEHGFRKWFLRRVMFLVEDDTKQYNIERFKHIDPVRKKPHFWLRVDVCHRDKRILNERNLTGKMETA
jgi:hypothetical protein